MNICNLIFCEWNPRDLVNNGNDKQRFVTQVDNKNCSTKYATLFCVFTRELGEIFKSHTTTIIS